MTQWPYAERDWGNYPDGLKLSHGIESDVNCVIKYMKGRCLFMWNWIIRKLKEWLTVDPEDMVWHKKEEDDNER